ncbi:MAG: FxLD family lanthipeptide [Terriglobales bacterium]
MNAPTITNEQTETATNAGLALDLDVRIVTTGPVAAALLSSTDDGCDTVRGSGC